MRKLVLAAFLLALSVPASAESIAALRAADDAPKVVKLYGGANAVWFDDNGLPSDFEIGGTGRASLSPHLSLVGSAFYGIDKSYLTAAGGLRITATDVNDPDFSIGFGMQYRASSKPGVRPEEWYPDVSLGWKPWPVEMPNVVVGVQGGYGLTSNQAFALVALRFYLTQF